MDNTSTIRSYSFFLKIEAHYQKSFCKFLENENCGQLLENCQLHELRLRLHEIRYVKIRLG